jgi:uncharacterized protein (TIGR02145 family)
MNLLILSIFSLYLGLGVPPPKQDSSSKITIKDREGQVYEAVLIGSQWWFTQNLRVTVYTNGDVIPYIEDKKIWSDTRNGARVAYLNDLDRIAIDGYLYNWPAINDERGLCPTGWRIPSESDWFMLEQFLGMDDQEIKYPGARGALDGIGGYLKDTAEDAWIQPNIGANNKVGFNGRASGIRTFNGHFNGYGYLGFWWSSTSRDKSEFNKNRVWVRFLSNHAQHISRNYSYMQSGLSVRCIKEN